MADRTFYMYMFLLWLLGAMGLNVIYALPQGNDQKGFRMRLPRKDDVRVHQVEGLARNEFSWLRLLREDEFSGQQGKVLEGQVRDRPSRHVCDQPAARAADYEAEDRDMENMVTSKEPVGNAGKDQATVRKSGHEVEDQDRESMVTGKAFTNDEDKNVNLTSSRSTSSKDGDQESDELILMHRKRGRSPSPRRRRRARAERKAERQRQESRHSWSIGAGKTRASTETCSRRPLTAPWQKGMQEERGHRRPGHLRRFLLFPRYQMAPLTLCGGAKSLGSKMLCKKMTVSWTIAR